MSLQPTADRWTAAADFGGRTVHVIEFDRLNIRDDERETAQSIAVMQSAATRDAGAPAVLRAVRTALLSQPGSSESTQAACDAVFNFARRTVRYADDAELNTPFASKTCLYDQTVISPAALLSMSRPRGNCVAFSCLVASMLRALGIPAAFKTVAADPQLREYSHVYVVAELAPGDFYTLDASNAPAPGWEFQKAEGSKARIWPNPADFDDTAMIHDRRQFPAPAARYPGAAAPPLTLETLNNAVALVRQGFSMGQRLGSVYEPFNIDTYGQGAEVATAPRSNDWAGFLSTLVNSTSRIVAPMIRQNTIAPPEYIKGANGAQILYDPSTGRVLNAGDSAQRAPALISQNLLIGAGVLGAVLIALQMAKGK